MDDVNTRFILAYETHSDALYRYCRFRVSDHEKARDLVQDAFTRTWSRIVEKGEVDDLKSFLYRTLRNLIIDHYRSKRTVSLETLCEETAFDPPAPIEVSETDRLDGELALKLLDQIPEQYREVIVMRYVQGLELKEIAGILEEPENTIAVRFHRGIEKVRKIFNHEQ